MSLDELIKEINQAKEDYYSIGRSKYTDREYDLMVSQAEKLGYIESVGAAPVKEIPTIKHEHLMLSLDKVHTKKEIDDFVNDKHVLFMYKADGLSISATYIDGVLTRLETRGNGDIGNDVMVHANSFVNLPKTINKSGKYVIDGECVILYPDFEKINENLVDKFSNPRNLAAGSLNQLDPEVSKKRYLRFYAWDVIEGGKNNSLYTNLGEAKILGFDCVKYKLVESDGTGNYNYDNDLGLLRMSAKEEGFPIDGVVIKYLDIEYGKSLGKTAHHFKNGVAYKFEDDRYPTKLRSVYFQMGKTGQLTPVATFDPVEISGSVVEKASLHNISILKQLQLTNGCTCYVFKANDIIPQIDCADPDGDGEIEVPKVCPECGSELKIVKENDSEVLYCSNPSCPGRILGLWKVFVSKPGMNVDGLSEERLQKLLRTGYLTNMFVSLYDLHNFREELYKVEGFGKKLVNNIIAAIEASKSVDFQHFITAFSIEGIGVGQAKTIANRFKTFEKFAEACENDFDFGKVSGFGPTINRNIHNWWVNNHVQMLDVAERVHFITDDFMNPPTGSVTPITGKIFVITGKLKHFANRDKLVEEIESLGGKVSGSISKNTDYLINNDVNSQSTKNKKAQSMGIPIISEEQFIRISKGE